MNEKKCVYMKNNTQIIIKEKKKSTFRVYFGLVEERAEKETIKIIKLENHSQTQRYAYIHPAGRRAIK